MRHVLSTGSNSLTRPEVVLGMRAVREGASGRTPLDGRVRSSILALHSFRGYVLHPGYLSLWV